MTTIERPESGEYAGFYASYVGRVGEADPLPVLETQPEILGALAGRLPTPERQQHRYAPGKWSVREVFGHLLDAERVFGYRAFCVGRRDATPLPGFSENDFVERSRFDATPLLELVEEFSLLRRSHVLMLRKLDAPGQRFVGNANGTPISARALAFIMAGHVRHHLAILEERYGVS